MTARGYRIPELLRLLNIENRRTFERQRAAGALPYLEEILPRVGRRPLYRADLVDAYLAGAGARGLAALRRPGRHYFKHAAG